VVLFALPAKVYIQCTTAIFRLQRITFNAFQDDKNILDNKQKKINHLRYIFHIQNE